MHLWTLQCSLSLQTTRFTVHKNMATKQYLSETQVNTDDERRSDHIEQVNPQHPKPVYLSSGVSMMMILPSGLINDAIFIFKKSKKD